MDQHNGYYNFIGNERKYKILTLKTELTNQQNSLINLAEKSNQIVESSFVVANALLEKNAKYLE